LIILGILAAPSLLLAKRPDAQQVLDKVAPYQGWIGVVFCIWGVWGTIDAVLHLRLLGLIPIWWLTWLASSVLTAALGFILGYGLIAGFIASNAQAKAKAAQLLSKLVPIPGKLGLAAICLGVWCVVAALLFHI
jgi:hypothetical protein